MERKEAIEIVKKLYNESLFLKKDKEAMVTLIPELKENGDEEIRKAVIYGMHALKGQHKTCFASIPIDNVIAWLEKQDKKVEPIESFNTEFERQISHIIASTINKEYEYTEDSVKWASNALLNYAKHEIDKQGEQKPTSDTMYEVKASDSLSVGNGKPFDYEHATITQEDFAPKVEPKFKVGDWIVCCDYEPVQIIGIRTNTYYEMSNGDIRPIYMVDNNYNIRLWTIQDAKDGDVLMSRSPFIYGKQCPYGGLDWYTNKFIKASNFIFTDSPVHPANKEQRNLLFQKMKEAGYEWDADKKELKKVDQNPINKIEPKFKVGDYIERKDGLGCHAKIIFVGKNVYGCKKLIYPEDSSPFFKLMFENQDEFKISSDFQQKPAWSEEGMKTLAKMMFAFKTMVLPSADECNSFIEFLKSIRDKGSPQFNPVLTNEDSPHSAWSKKDSLYYDDICEILINLLHSESPNVNKSAIQKDLDWFITFVTQTKK